MYGGVDRLPRGNGQSLRRTVGVTKRITSQRWTCKDHHGRRDEDGCKRFFHWWRDIKLKLACGGEEVHGLDSLVRFFFGLNAKEEVRTWRPYGNNFDGYNY